MIRYDMIRLIRRPEFFCSHLVLSWVFSRSLMREVTNATSLLQVPLAHVAATLAYGTWVVDVLCTFQGLSIPQVSFISLQAWKCCNISCTTLYTGWTWTTFTPYGSAWYAYSMFTIFTVFTVTLSGLSCLCWDCSRPDCAAPSWRS